MLVTLFNLGFSIRGKRSRNMTVTRVIIALGRIRSKEARRCRHWLVRPSQTRFARDPDDVVAAIPARCGIARSAGSASAECWANVSGVRLTFSRQWAISVVKYKKYSVSASIKQNTRTIHLFLSTLNVEHDKWWSVERNTQKKRATRSAVFYAFVFSSCSVFISPY